MRIANFLLKPSSGQTTPPAPADAPKLSSGIMVRNSAAQNSSPLVVAADGIWNDHEPLSSDDLPSPQFANFYKSNHFVYHHLAGKWRRTSLLTFNP
jgi:hypothetical protein